MIRYALILTAALLSTQIAKADEKTTEVFSVKCPQNTVVATPSPTPTVQATNGTEAFSVKCPQNIAAMPTTVATPYTGINTPEGKFASDKDPIDKPAKEKIGDNLSQMVKICNKHTETILATSRMAWEEEGVPTNMPSANVCINAMKYTAKFEEMCHQVRVLHCNKLMELKQESEAKLLAKQANQEVEDLAKLKKLKEEINK
jgi:uncharacterized protein (DUF2252 family)